MDVLVIGSGFGGSIAAKRFTEAGHRVTLLELGEDWRDLAKAQQVQDPKYLFRLLRNYPTDPLRTKPHLQITVGMGLGGGSLVYSGIHLRAPSQAFAPWPRGWTRAHLDPYYARVEHRLAVAPLADALAFPRTRAFAEGAKKAGLPPPVANPLAMAPGCTRCGWCVPLCGYGQKTTMAHTYLADAVATGRLAIRTNTKAAWIARRGNGYRVAAWSTLGVAKEYHRVASGPLAYLDADRVVVAGGAIESPALLLRSLAAELPAGVERLRPLSARLGHGLDGTGDFVQGGFVPQRVDGFKGAVMMSYIDLGDYVLEDIHGVPVGAAVTLGARLASQSKDWGAAYKQSFRQYGAHLLALGVIGKQGAGTAGNISVSDDGGNAAISTAAYAPPAGALEAARSVIRGLGGEVALTPWEISGTAISVHPTGGCAMGDDDAAVVRASDLGVRDNPGLYVIDGSVLPGNPMRNPSHTIAAVAERGLDVILGASAAERWPS